MPVGAAIYINFRHIVAARWAESESGLRAKTLLADNGIFEAAVRQHAQNAVVAQQLTIAAVHAACRLWAALQVPQALGGQRE